MIAKMAVVGAGRMGKLHARVFSELDGTEIVCVVDSNPAAADALARQRNCIALTRAEEAVDMVDAAIISVPTAAHVEAAKPFVLAGKAVLIEKPIACDADSGRELIALANEHGAVVQIGHAERFNPVVIAMKKYAIRPKFIEAHRISPFTFRSADVGVVLDMMIHDIDLVLMLAGGKVQSLHAVGINVIGEHEDICNARLIFDNGLVANLTASRLAIKTERKMHVFSEEAYLSVDYAKKIGMVVRKSANLDLIQMARELNVDDLAELAEIVDYKQLVNAEQLIVDESIEPLKSQAQMFLDTVVNGADVSVSAEEGLAAVQVANDIVECIKTYRWDGQDSPRVGLDIISKGV